MSMPLQLVLSYVTFDANGSRVSNSRRVLCVFLFGGILLWLKWFYLIIYVNLRR